jgi:hypothetical protein
MLALSNRFLYVTEITRILTTDQLGRSILLKSNPRKPVGFIILTYPSRAMEWLNLRTLFAECLSHFSLEQFVLHIEEVMIAWKYHNNMSMLLYRPALVFRDFAFLQLLDPTDECLCRKSKRLAKYLDVRTVEETSSFADAQVHVRTINTNIIHHKRLKQAVAMGLNHIPLKPTSKLDVSIAVAIDGFSQLSQILSLEKAGLNLDLANEWIRATCLEQLKVASRTNKYVFKVSGTDLLREECVKEEIKWLTTHLFSPGLISMSPLNINVSLL